VKTLLCGAAELSQKRKENDSLSFRKSFERLFHRVAMTGEGAFDQFTTLRSELDDPGTAVPRVVRADNKSSGS